MKKSTVAASFSALLLGGLLTMAATGAMAASEETLTLQDFENKEIALGPWGSLQAELVDDDSQDGAKAGHFFWEDDADQWCGVTVPIEPFTEDYTKLRLRFKGTGSKKTISIFLYDNGGERYSSSIADKSPDWTTVEIPIKRFGVDGWQPDDSDKNKKKDYPFKTLMLQRNGKGGHDFFMDLIEVVK